MFDGWPNCLLAAGENRTASREKSIDDVARISLQDEPDFPGRTQIKRAGGAEGKVHFESGSSVDFADHGNAALLD